MSVSFANVVYSSISKSRNFYMFIWYSYFEVVAIHSWQRSLRSPVSLQSDGGWSLVNYGAIGKRLGVCCMYIECLWLSVRKCTWFTSVPHIFNTVTMKSDRQWRIWGGGRSGDRLPRSGKFFSVVGGSAEPPVKTLLGGGRSDNF
jgi:hypothetical protein